MSDKILDNDARAEQSLKMFKNWLAKHPYIKYEGEGEDVRELQGFTW